MEEEHYRRMTNVSSRRYENVDEQIELLDRKETFLFEDDVSVEELLHHRWAKDNVEHFR